MKLISMNRAKIGVLIAAMAVGSAVAEPANDQSRAVRIIDGPAVPETTPSLAPAAPAPALTTPAPSTSSPPLLLAPSPALAPPSSSPAPQLVTPTPAPLEPLSPAPQLATPAPILTPLPAPPIPPAQIVTPAPPPPAPVIPPPQLATPAPPPAPLTPPPQLSTTALPPLVPPTASLPPLVPTPELAPLAPPPPPESAAVLPVPPEPGMPTAPPATAAAPSNYDVMSLPPAPGNLHPPSPSFNLPALDTKLAVANPADLSIDILPGNDIKVGARVAFRVSTKKAGYLILVDVDSAGKLTQIFPNPMSLMAVTNDRQNPHANFIKPGKPVQIPDAKAAATGFEFVASPPLGVAMVVAILSDRPVQLVDLPDVPAALVGHAGALTYLNKVAGELRLPPAGDSGPLLDPKWSLDAKFYAIR